MGKFETRPRFGRMYYAMSAYGDIVSLMWSESFEDNLNFIAGNCFKDFNSAYFARPVLYAHIMGENADRNILDNFIRLAKELKEVVEGNVQSK